MYVHNDRIKTKEKKKMAKTETLTIRCDEQFQRELEALADTYKMTRTSVINRLVHLEYLKATEVGKKEIKKTMDTFETLQRQIESLALERK